MPHRIGILLNGLEGKANTVAIRYLILQMNGLQKTFEYEFLPYAADDFLVTLRSESPIDRHHVKTELPAFYERYRAYLTSLNASHSLKEAPPEYFVVICLSTFKDNYYTTRK